VLLSSSVRHRRRDIGHHVSLRFRVCGAGKYSAHAQVGGANSVWLTVTGHLRAGERREAPGPVLLDVRSYVGDAALAEMMTTWRKARLAQP